jgi:hypothetical protein
MLAPLVIAALCGAQAPAVPAQSHLPKVEATPASAQVDAASQPKEAKPIQSFSFGSATYAFAWDQLLPVDLDVDGLRVKTIFFNEREPKNRFLKGRKFGFRAQLEVKNTSPKPRTPGFVVAVLDEEGRLLGAASGGTRFGTVKAGETETFDLNFFQVKQRLRRGAKFLFSIELRD